MRFPTPTNRLALPALLAISLAAVALVLFSTPYGGLNIDVDSVEYYAQARSLRAGVGSLFFTGNYDANFPPGYSIFLIAAGMLGDAVGVMPAEAARWLQAVVHGLTVLLAGLLYFRELRSKTLALVGALAVAGSLPLVQAAVSAWSESVFILLSLPIFLLLRRYLLRPSPGVLAAAIALTAASCIQRYMGVTIIAAGSLAILLYARESLPRRLRDSILYGVLSFAPLAARFLYNMSQVGLPAGGRPPAVISGLDASIDASNILTAWIVPFDTKSTLPPIGLLVLLAICAAMMVGALRRGNAASPPLPATFVLVYCVLLVAAHTVIDITRINNRELAPIYPYLIAVLFGLLEGVERRLTARSRRAWLRYAVAVPALLWLAVYPLSQTAQEVRALRTWCCQRTEWEQVEVVQWLTRHDLSGVVLSNSTLPLYTARFGTIYMLSLSGDLNAFEALAHPGDTVVWFSDSVKKRCGPSSWYCHKTTYTLDDLRPRLEPIAELADGGIYRVVR